MVAHWTYEDFRREDDLEQGDLIRPSPDVRAILDSYHRYFADNKYTIFLISTQSCDLVRRKGGEPKTSYITIAAARPLRLIVSRLLSEVVTKVGDGLYRKSAQGQWRDFLNRLFNQNEQALGLFYLHKDSDAGVDEDSVAFLRVTVPLKAEHYNVIREARVGRLRADFRAKLGWLLGNLFARPATTDWSEGANDEARLKTLVNEYIHIPSCRWIDDVIVDEARRQHIPLDGKTEDEIDALRPTPPLDSAIDEVAKQLRSALHRPRPQGEQSTATNQNVDADELIDTLRRRLKSSPKFKALLSTVALQR